MACDHCCYSCRPGKGQHMDFSTALDAIAFAADYTESISIGGGEPTLHPRFFDILSACLSRFDYVWLATNGSQTKSMHRLANIIDGNDAASFDPEDYCTCETEEERESCYCEPSGLIYQEDKLSVALSTDHYHDPIDSRIEALWRRRAGAHRHSHFELRDNSRHVINTGRAMKSGAGLENDRCCCSDLFIRPDGKIKACGCARSKIIGDVWRGFTQEGEKLLDSGKFRATSCYFGRG